MAVIAIRSNTIVNQKQMPEIYLLQCDEGVKRKERENKERPKWENGGRSVDWRRGL